MAKARMGRWEYTEQELDRMFDEATIRGKLAATVEPQAKSVHYDHETNRVVVDLKNGATFIFPCELVQGLGGASAHDIAQVELGSRGASLHWEKLDLDFSVVGLMSGVFGNKAWMKSLEHSGGRGKAGSGIGPIGVTDSARVDQNHKRSSKRAKLAKSPRAGTQRP
jgi:hypothetical protein